MGVHCVRWLSDGTSLLQKFWRDEMKTDAIKMGLLCASRGPGSVCAPATSSLLPGEAEILRNQQVSAF